MLFVYGKRLVINVICYFLKSYTTHPSPKFSHFYDNLILTDINSFHCIYLAQLYGLTKVISPGGWYLKLSRILPLAHCSPRWLDQATYYPHNQD